MNQLELMISSIVKIFLTISFADVVDIIIVSFLIYKVINLVQETRAEQLVKGIVLLAITSFLATQFELKTVAFVLKNIFQIGIIALIVLFQPELRRVLEKIGRTKVSDISGIVTDTTDKAPIWDKPIDDITFACAELSQTTTGALIVIECSTKLGEQIDTGVLLNAATSKEIFGNIFFPNTPLHDGATIVRDGMIIASACFLPKPLKEEGISTNLGSRHRAAIGMSEVSDAIIIVVSEETGTISIAREGVLQRDFTPSALHDYLTAVLVPQKQKAKTRFSKIKKLHNKKGGK